MKLLFAPLQGYTDSVYRNAHNVIIGGVDAYFTPFLRWDGGLRNKDLRDVAKANNSSVNVIPQVIAANRGELAALLDVVQTEGYSRVDLNLGCPFPLQTGRGRGSALLAQPDKVRELMEELNRHDGLTISVKMRCGFDDKTEGLEIMGVLNDYELEFVTIHPRVGRQQYKGEVDMEAFDGMLRLSHNPVVYNGDLACVEDIECVMSRYPQLYGVMIGRGLLARPTLFRECRDGIGVSDGEALRLSLELHRVVYDAACRMLQGESQLLARMHAFWEYQKPLVDKKVYKRLMKAGSLKNYEEAVRSLM